ncbi:MAG: ComEC/Rec2 family competence protein [Clostridia bacterium]
MMPKLVAGEVGMMIWFILLFTFLLTTLLVLKKTARFLLFLFCFAVGFGYSFYASIPKYPILPTAKYNISGTIYALSETYNTFLITDVKVNQKPQQNIYLKVFDAIDAQVCDKIIFDGKLEKVNLFESNGDQNIFNIKENIGYIVQVNAKNVEVKKCDPSLKEQIKQRTQIQFRKYMNKDNASISYTALFGDKSNLDYDILQDFQKSGIAHLLAVSGLHVGFFVAMLMWILKKIKISNFAQLIIFFIVLLFYCWLCSFSPSVMRASIMALFLLICKCFGKQYDGLTSLGIAGLIIIIFFPLSPLSGSFKFSFLSVFAIYSMAFSLIKIFEKWHIPKFVAGSLAITISIQIAILPLMGGFKSGVNMLSFIANLVCIPLFQIVYISNFVLLFVSIIPIFGFLFYLPAKFLEIICFAAKNIAEVSGAIFVFDKLPSQIIQAYEYCFFVVGGLYMSNAINKIVCTCGVVGITIFAFSINALLNYYNIFFI